MADHAELSRHPQQHTKKVEILKDIQQLKIRIQNLEKERHAQIFNKRGEFYKDFVHLQELDQKNFAARKEADVRVKQQLNKIKTSVKKFQRELQDVQPTPEFLEKLKVMMSDIEIHISQFKEQQKEEYDELLREESLTTQEVMALDKKFDSWAQLGPAKLDLGNAVKTRKHGNIAQDLPPEVAIFDKFVAQSGGIRGGWDDYDHGTFLKYRNRHNGKPTFMRELIGFLPTKTEQEIRSHEMWFQKYNELNDNKKEAIIKWREKKEVERETRLGDAAKSELGDAAESARRDAAAARQAEEERQQRRAELNRWKVEKELERAEEEERKLRAEIEKVKRMEEEQKRQEEKKKKVEEYRKMKEEEEEMIRCEKAIKAELELEKRKVATKEVQKLHQRDINATKEKVAQEKMKLQQEEERKKRIQAKLKEQNEAHINRDPNRLLKPTQVWKDRQKDQTKPSGQLLHMPHRAVPSWRHGVS